MAPPPAQVSRWFHSSSFPQHRFKPLIGTQQERWQAQSARRRDMDVIQGMGGVVGGVDAIVGWGGGDGGPLMRMRPTPVVCVSRSMGVCYASHLLPLFASRVRWVCAMLATSSHRSRLAFDGGVHPPHPHVVRVSRSMRCAVLATSSHRSRLTFDEGVLWHPPPPPVVRVSRSMDLCSASYLHLSFASCVRLGVGSASHPSFTFHVR